VNDSKPSLTVLCNHALANGISWLHTQQKFPTRLFATTATGDIITLNLDALPSHDALRYARAVLRIERASHYTVVGLARGNTSPRPDTAEENGPHEILFALAADVGMAVYSSAEITRADGNRVIGINPLGYADASHSGKLAGLLWPGSSDISDLPTIAAHWQQHRVVVPVGQPHEPN
jgi:hypothetical protein